MEYEAKNSRSVCFRLLNFAAVEENSIFLTSQRKRCFELRQFFPRLALKTSFPALENRCMLSRARHLFSVLFLVACCYWLHVYPTLALVIYFQAHRNWIYDTERLTKIFLKLENLIFGLFSVWIVCRPCSNQHEVKMQ